MVTTRSAAIRRSARLGGSSSNIISLAINEPKHPKAGVRRVGRKRKRAETEEDEEDEESILAVPSDKKKAKKIKKEDNGLSCSAGSSQKTESESDGKKADDDAAKEKDMEKKREAESTLKFMEDHLTCSLCCEVMTFPHTIPEPRCGHTFCGMCILKWFFSRMHTECGHWHELVECPLCRAAMKETPESSPRDIKSFPFVPNRMVDECINACVEKLAGGGPEANDGAPAQKARNGKGKSPAKVKKEESVPLDIGLGIEAWVAGGALNEDWKRRERDGRKEMDDILGRWKFLQPRDFVQIKLRLNL